MNEYDTPTPPADLAADGQHMWTSIHEMIDDFDPHHLELLAAACRQCDRAASARAEIAKHGLTIQDRYGQLKLNPAVEAERTAHTVMMRLLRETGIDVDGAHEVRAPRRVGTA